MIGKVEIFYCIVLVLMVGIINFVFCIIVKEFGVGFVVMEMIFEKGLFYNNEKILYMFYIDENEYFMLI